MILREIAGQLRLQHRHRADQHLAVGAVDGDHVTGLQRLPGRREGAGLVVDADGAGARHARLAHAAGNHRRVAGHAAAGGEDALGGVHAVDVFGAGLDADQDDRLALAGEALGLLRREHGFAAGGPRRCRETGGEHVALGLRVDGGVQELVERGRVDAHHRLVRLDQPFLDHVDGDLEGGLGRPLAAAGLQHPQLAALDGELDVLHLAVVLLEPVADLAELGERLGKRGLQRRLLRRARFQPRLLGDRLGRADAGDHVLALGVHEELAVELVLAGGRIAGEGDAGGRRVAHVAEHHRLDVDGGAPALGDLLQPAIGDRAGVHPRAEHGGDRAPQLVARVLRERLAELVLHQRLVALDDDLPVLGGQVGVQLDVLVVLEGLQDALEVVMLQAHHHVAVHLDETTVGIVGEAGIAGVLGERADGVVVEAEVEDGVHHAGHGDAGARAHGDEQRPGHVAEHAAGGLPDLGQRRLDLVGELVRIGPVGLGEVGTDFGGDGEAWRNGNADVGHLGQIGALAAEEIAHAGLAFCGAVPERVDPLVHHSSFLRPFDRRVRSGGERAASHGSAV